MSGSLAEVICQAAFDRHVLIDRTNCEALAAAARAFIGDEIAAEHERLHYSTENVSETRQLRDAQWWHNGMVKAESIARGDTK
jgi:hypothetical protein